MIETDQEKSAPSFSPQRCIFPMTIPPNILPENQISIRKMKKWIPLVAIGIMGTSYAHGNPIAHYTFDDSNDRYKDSSGNGYHGTLSGSGTSFASSGVSGLGDAMNSSTDSRVITATIPVNLNQFTISF